MIMEQEQTFAIWETRDQKRRAENGGHSGLAMDLILFLIQESRNRTVNYFHNCFNTINQILKFQNTKKKPETAFSEKYINKSKRVGQE